VTAPLRALGARTYLAYRRVRAGAARTVHETAGRVAALSARALFGRGDGALPASPETILAVSLQKIGDAVATEPALRLLAERFPRARIEVAAAASRERGPDMGAVEVYRMVPSVAAVHPIRHWRDLRALAGKQDLVLGFGLRARDAWAALLARGGRGSALGYSWRGRGSALDVRLAPPDQVMLTAAQAAARSARPQHELWGELLFRARLVDEDALQRMGPPRLQVPERAAEDAKALLAERGIPEGFVAVAPWNEQGHYRWPEASWIALLSALGRGVAILGGHSRGEMAHAARLAAATGAWSFAGELPLDRTAAILARASAVIAVDSGPAHVARAVGARTLVLFGPGSPPVWSPPGARFLQRTDLCHGCRQPRCYRQRRECLDDLPVDTVREVAKELLG
jgi:ADP-heptose:LPS heptosyltransferase